MLGGELHHLPVPALAREQAAGADPYFCRWLNDQSAVTVNEEGSWGGGTYVFQDGSAQRFDQAVVGGNRPDTCVGTTCPVCST